MIKPICLPKTSWISDLPTKKGDNRMVEQSRFPVIERTCHLRVVTCHPEETRPICFTADPTSR